MRGYPQFSFWISITLVKIYISCVIINRGKNTIELVGTVLNMLVNLITPEADKLKYWDFGSEKKKRKLISGKNCSLAFCCNLDS